jgi:hypothetical protein
MAKQTWQPRVIAIVVLELHVIGLGQRTLIADNDKYKGKKDFHHFVGFGIALT